MIQTHTAEQPSPLEPPVRHEPIVIPHMSRAVSLAAALVVVCMVWASVAVAQPSTGADTDVTRSTPSSAPRVSLEATHTSVTAEGELDYTVWVYLPKRTEYVQARFQLTSPSGRLIYQRTRVRNDVGPGTVPFRFTRPLGDIGLDPAAYPVVARVRTGTRSDSSIETSDSLRVYDPKQPQTPVVIAFRVSPAPAFDADGRFVIDPATATRARDDVDTICELVEQDSKARVSLAIPPVTLEEWRRIADGYELVGLEGVQEISEESEVAVAYGATLERLKRALATGRLELLPVPYADPDPTGLLDMQRIPDLSRQSARGTSTVFAVLGSEPTGVVSVATSCLSQPIAEALWDDGRTSGLVDRDCARLGTHRPSSGVYRMTGVAGFTALVVDDVASEAFGAPSTSALRDRVFSRAVSSAAALPLITVVDLGPGSAVSARAAARMVSALETEPWARLVSTASISGKPLRSSIRTLDRPPGGRKAPAGYWDDVKTARRKAEAVTGALPRNDSVAEAATLRSLIAESRAWAGPDGRWAASDRGRAFASSAARAADAVLAKVGVKIADVTLSGAKGDVPASIVNRTRKPLTLTVVTSAEGFSADSEREIEARPGETYLELPVNLGSALSGRLDVTVRAGVVDITSGSAKVTASYLDRLAILGMLVVGMLGTLVYIRKRVLSRPVPDDA